MASAASDKTGSYSSSRRLRLAYFVSHPIQYQVPLLRRIAQEPDIDLKVFFSSDISTRSYMDPGFGVAVKWDVPLLTGYQHEFLPRLRDSNQLGFFGPFNHGIWSRMQKGHYDALWVHGYSTMVNLQTILSANSLGIPVMLRAESTLFNPRSRIKKAVKELFFAALKGRIAAALSIGEANATYWRRYFGEELPIFPFNYSVDNDFFRKKCEQAALTREDFRRELGLQPGRPVILFASKLQTRKRCIDLLEAFFSFSASSSLQLKPYLLIVGDGEERAVLESRAKAAAPGDVRFLGFQNQTELPRFYNLCDVFVLASVDEPWGLVINEVMNAGRPVIVTDQVGCQKDLVQHGVNGCVVGAGDVEALAQALHTILDDAERAEEMGRRSLEIIQNYSFEQNVSGLRKALEAVVPGFVAVPGPF